MTFAGPLCIFLQAFCSKVLPALCHHRGYLLAPCPLSLCLSYCLFYVPCFLTVTPSFPPLVHQNLWVLIFIFAKVMFFRLLRMLRCSLLPYTKSSDVLFEMAGGSLHMSSIGLGLELLASNSSCNVVSASLVAADFAWQTRLKASAMQMSCDWRSER